MKVLIICLFFCFISCENDESRVRQYMLDNIIDDPNDFEVTNISYYKIISKKEFLIDKYSNMKRSILRKAKKQNIRLLYNDYKRKGGNLKEEKFKRLFFDISPEELIKIDDILNQKYNIEVINQYFIINDGFVLTLFQTMEGRKEYDSLNNLMTNVKLENDSSPFLYKGIVKVRQKDVNGKLKLKTYKFVKNSDNKIVEVRK